MTKSDSLSLPEARTGRSARNAGPSDGGREGLVAGRVEDDPDRRDAIDHERDRDAEDGQAVGVVHRAVEGIDDPDPATPRGGRLARDGAMLPGLLGKDRVVRVARPDGVQDERLGQVVRLGHHVPGALVVDPLEPFVAVHQHRPRAPRDLEREGELGVDVRGDGRHGALQSTVNGRGTVPSSVTVWVKVTVWPGFDLRAQEERPGTPRAIGRVEHATGRPAAAAPRVRHGQRDGQAGSRRSTAAPSTPRTARPRPAPAARRWPGRRRTAMTPPIAMPWTCDDDESRSPSGLHRLAQPDVERRPARRTGRTGGSAPAWPGRSAGGLGLHHQRADRLDQRVDVGRRPGQDDRAVRAGRLPASPGLARRGHPGESATDSSLSQSPWNPTITSWSSRRRPLASSEFEVERQVRLEVDVERGPAVADPAGQPGTGRGLATDQDRRRRHGDRDTRPRPAAGRTGSRG